MFGRINGQPFDNPIREGCQRFVQDAKLNVDALLVPQAASLWPPECNVLTLQ
jgi:hypothetical protein